jgi:O-antigen ligase
MVLQPTLVGQGYLVIALGWFTLYLSLKVFSQNRRAQRRFVSLVIGLSLTEALIGLSQSLRIFDPLAFYRLNGPVSATGTYINYNHFAGFLNMGIPLTIGALVAVLSIKSESLRSEAGGRAWLLLLAGSLMGLAVLISLSRAGSVTFVLTLLFLSFLVALRGRRKQLPRVPLSVAIALLLTSLVLFVGVGTRGLSARFSILEGSWEVRRTVYSDTVRMISDVPLTGIGSGMFRWQFRSYQTLDANTWWQHAHNDYLESAAEFGIPLAVAFWGFVLWRFHRSVRLFLVSSSLRVIGIALACSGAIFSILVHSLVDFNLHIPANLMLFCMILGLSLAIDKMNSTCGQESRVGHAFSRAQFPSAPRDQRGG